jgi:hypothetical protein
MGGFYYSLELGDGVIMLIMLRGYGLWVMDVVARREPKSPRAVSEFDHNCFAKTVCGCL